MSTKGIESVLARAMSDPAFAENLLANPEKALAEYELPADIIAKFKGMSRAEFEALEAEDRRSMSVRPGALKKGTGKVNCSDITLSKPIDASSV